MSDDERREVAERDLLIIDSHIPETILPWQWRIATELLAGLYPPLTHRRQHP